MDLKALPTVKSRAGSIVSHVMRGLGKFQARASCLYYDAVPELWLCGAAFQIWPRFGLLVKFPAQKNNVFETVICIS